MRSVILLALFFAALCHGQVAAGGGGACGTLTGTSPISCSVNVGSSGAVYLGAVLVCAGGSSISVTATYGGSSLTVGTVQTGGGDALVVPIYGASSLTGSNTLSVSWTGSGVSNCAVSEAYYTGVGSQAQATAGSCVAAGGSNNEACTVGVTTSNANAWVVALMSMSPAGASPGGAETPATSRALNPGAAIGDLGPVSAGSHTITFGVCSYCGTPTFNAVMLELVPAGGSSAVIQSHLIIH